MTGTHTPQIAVIGSGPSGCYLAQSLARTLPAAEITVFDRLASPFGLIRYGVAADHQHTKTITRQFERLFQSPNVRFAGNIEIGRDLSIDTLRHHYDAVVFATGLTEDQALGVPGEQLAGIVGAGTLTRALNAHPHEPTTLPDLGEDVVIVGAGNVALDLIRFLVKEREQFVGSDISDPILDQYLRAPAKRITVVSRSAAATSKGDALMLRELAELPRASYTLHPSSLPLFNAGVSQELDRAMSARLDAFEELLSPDRPQYPGPKVQLCFGLTPSRVLGTERVSGLKLTPHSSRAMTPTTPVTILASAIITAIGFAAAGPLASLTATAAVSPGEGRIEPGLYRTGWARRGPRGAIPENRSCAKSVAEEVTADFSSGQLPLSTAKLGFAGLPLEAQERAIAYQHWLNLEAHERECAPPGRVRRKLTNHDHMVSIARGRQ